VIAKRRSLLDPGPQRTGAGVAHRPPPQQHPTHPLILILFTPPPRAPGREEHLLSHEVAVTTTEDLEGIASLCVWTASLAPKSESLGAGTVAFSDYCSKWHLMAIKFCQTRSVIFKVSHALALLVHVAGLGRMLSKAKVIKTMIIMAAVNQRGSC
jgi:hypothetical protein